MTRYVPLINNPQRRLSQPEISRPRREYLLLGTRATTSHRGWLSIHYSYSEGGSNSLESHAAEDNVVPHTEAPHSGSNYIKTNRIRGQVAVPRFCLPKTKPMQSYYRYITAATSAAWNADVDDGGVTIVPSSVGCHSYAGSASTTIGANGPNSDGRVLLA